MPYSHGVPLHNLHLDVDVSVADQALGPGVVAVVVNGTLGDVALRDIHGTEVVYDEATITAWQRIIPGEWAAVLNADTTATGLVAWLHTPYHLDGG